MESEAQTGHRRIRQLVTGFAFPSAFYLIAFCLLTYPLCTLFWKEFYGLWFGDCVVSLWNLWWVERAVTDLHQLPWFSPDIFYPNGASLLGHTLCPYAGFVYIGLSPWLSLIQAYNLILILSFVLSGLMAFYLCRKMTGSYWGSLVGGFVYTFSSYHFIHHAHMNLFNMQWIPAFFLAWYCFLESPHVGRAILVSLTLFLNVLCDYYYTMYCVLGAVIMFAWFATRRRDLFFLLRPPQLRPSIIFLLSTILTTGVLCGAFVAADHATPFRGAHDPALFSLDLASICVPGVGWRFLHWTTFYWQAIPDFANGYHLGISTIAMALIVIFRRRETKVHCPSLNLWCVLGCLFFLCALGPIVRAFGTEILSTATPYSMLKVVVPVLKVGGVPARMMVITQLSLSVLVALFVQLAAQSGTRTRVAAGVLLCVLVVEYLPGRLFHTPLSPPGHALVLAEQEHDGAFLDAATPWTDRGYMYAQVTHQKPMWAGALARRSKADMRHAKHLMTRFSERNFDSLVNRHGYAFFLTAAPLAPPPAPFHAELLYSGPDGYLYHVEHSGL